jgi:hypothetical protein
MGSISAGRALRRSRASACEWRAGSQPAALRCAGSPAPPGPSSRSSGYQHRAVQRAAGVAGRPCGGGGGAAKQPGCNDPGRRSAAAGAREGWRIAGCCGAAGSAACGLLGRWRRAARMHGQPLSQRRAAQLGPCGWGGAGRLPRCATLVVFRANGRTACCLTAAAGTERVALERQRARAPSRRQLPKSSQQQPAASRSAAHLGTSMEAEYCLDMALKKLGSLTCGAGGRVGGGEVGGQGGGWGVGGPGRPAARPPACCGRGSPPPAAQQRQRQQRQTSSPAARQRAARRRRTRCCAAAAARSAGRAGPTASALQPCRGAAGGAGAILSSASCITARTRRPSVGRRPARRTPRHSAGACRARVLGEQLGRRRCDAARSVTRAGGQADGKGRREPGRARETSPNASHA